MVYYEKYIILKIIILSLIIFHISTFNILSTKQEKDKAFETLRMFLLQSKQDCTALLQELNRFEQTYEDKTAKPKTQSSIFSYFKAQ